MEWRWLLGIFLLALLIRAPFLPFNPLSQEPLVVTPEFSMDGYYPLAENLRAGNGYSILGPPYPPADIRTPGYPFFIVGLVELFGSYKALFVAQLILGAVCAALAYLIAREFVAQLWARIVGISIALEPLGAYLTGVILTETLFTTLFLGALYIWMRFARSKRLVLLLAFSATLAIATLVKPTVQYAPLLFLLLLYLVHDKKITRIFLLRGAAMLLVFFAVLSPWLLRNYQTFGVWGMSIQPVSNLYCCLVPSAISFDEQISFNEAQRAFYAQGKIDGVEDINLDNAGHYRAVALAELAEHPVGLLQSLGTTAYAFFFNDGYRNIVDRYFSIEQPTALALIGIGRLFWIAMTALAAWGAYAHYKKYGITQELVLLVGLVLYFAATTAINGLTVNGRFRLPVDTLIFILAAWGYVAASKIGIVKALGLR